MTPYDSQFLRDACGESPVSPQSYFHGAISANNYTPTQPYVVEVLPDPRLLKLRQRGSQWFWGNTPVF